ncbi:MAG: BON domain-containing protein [Pseudomonadota bacterium]
MKTFVAVLLASAASASFAAAPSSDPAAYRSATQKAEADYKQALTQCADMSGNPKAVCIDQAKVDRAHADADALAQYNDSARGRIKARSALADADYRLAKDKCADLSGAAKDSCISNAKAVHVAALADAKADRAVAVSTDTKSGEITVADRARDAAATVADKTERAADTMADKTASMANKTGGAVSDSVITTKVKADIFKEPELKSMAIHVETDKGVVMLSGFVDSKADADKAERLARSVNGVTDVKSSIKVK